MEKGIFSHEKFSRIEEPKRKKKSPLNNSDGESRFYEVFVLILTSYYQIRLRIVERLRYPNSTFFFGNKNHNIFLFFFSESFSDSQSHFLSPGSHSRKKYIKFRLKNHNTIILTTLQISPPETTYQKIASTPQISVLDRNPHNIT